MNIDASLVATSSNLLASAPSPRSDANPDDDGSPLRRTFDRFVGQTFYGQLIASMRQTVGKPAYFHGGRAEEIFRGQLDQALAEEMTQRTAGEFTDPMYELFTLPRAG